MKVKFKLNGKTAIAEFQPGLTLLEYLRDSGLKSVKYGCDHGECGACTVLIENKAQNACLVLLHTLAGKTVETLESLGSHDRLHPLQEKFIAAGAIQCGYCTPGILMALEALNRENSAPSEEQVRDALTGNLCRCTGYVKPVEAAL